MEQEKAAGGSIRVIVTGKRLHRLERGKSDGRLRVTYEKGAQLSVSPEFLKANRDRLAPVDDTPPIVTDSAGSGDADQGLAEIDRLRAEAAELGIEFDKRWREGRLRDEIRKAKEADQGLADDQAGDEQ